MELARQKILYSPEEYLELERRAETRHEFVDGIIYAMAGESLSHSRICINLAGEVRAQLKGKNCEALSPNMKVRAESKGMYAYPDLTIVCGKPLFHDRQRDVLLNPKVIIEVLSPSTEIYDRTTKFQKYRLGSPTLTDYILVSQDKAFVEHFSKQTDGNWIYRSYGEIEDFLRIETIEIELSLREIYDRVEFVVEEENDFGEFE